MNLLKCDSGMAKALEVTRQLALWFDRYDPSYQGHPNIRVSRTILCVCIGDDVIWNSKDHAWNDLSFAWIMEEYRMLLKDRFGPLETWFYDRTAFTENQI